MTNNKKKYRVVDWYEGYINLGYADTITEVKSIARKFYNDTDGECDIWYYPLNNDTQKYSADKGKIVRL